MIHIFQLKLGPSSFFNQAIEKLACYCLTYCSTSSHFVACCITCQGAVVVLHFTSVVARSFAHCFDPYQSKNHRQKNLSSVHLHLDIVILVPADSLIKRFLIFRQVLDVREILLLQKLLNYLLNVAVVLHSVHHAHGWILMLHGIHLVDLRLQLLNHLVKHVCATSLIWPLLLMRTVAVQTIWVNYASHLHT